jgi:hypothetical protein
MDAPKTKVDTTYKVDDPSAVTLPDNDSPSTQAPEKLFPDNPGYVCSCVSCELDVKEVVGQLRRRKLFTMRPK